MSAPSQGPVKSAEHALSYIHDGAAIGLGSGRAASAFVHALAARVRAGMHVRAVASSQATADLARQLGIPPTTLDADLPLDVTIDGADEVDPHLNLIKGRGGALVREKIVAAASRRLVILVDAGKLVPVLGTRGVLPVEVVPFGLALCRRRLRELGCEAVPRVLGDAPFVTDNGNHILDCAVGPIAQPAALEREIRAIPGVVGTGLFLGMAESVVIQDGDDVVVRQRQA